MRNRKDIRNLFDAVSECPQVRIKNSAIWSIICRDFFKLIFDK